MTEIMEKARDLYHKRHPHNADSRPWIYADMVAFAEQVENERWISIKTKLPDTSGQYLWQTKDGCLHLLNFRVNESENWWRTNYDAWRERPAPYEPK